VPLTLRRNPEGRSSGSRIDAKLGPKSRKLHRKSRPREGEGAAPPGRAAGAECDSTGKKDSSEEAVKNEGGVGRPHAPSARDGGGFRPVLGEADRFSGKASSAPTAYGLGAGWDRLTPAPNRFSRPGFSDPWAYGLPAPQNSLAPWRKGTPERHPRPVWPTEQSRRETDFISFARPSGVKTNSVLHRTRSEGRGDRDGRPGEPIRVAAPFSDIRSDITADGTRGRREKRRRGGGGHRVGKRPAISAAHTRGYSDAVYGLGRKFLAAPAARSGRADRAPKAAPNGRRKCAASTTTSHLHRQARR
jgi:hypothetical protein